VISLQLTNWAALHLTLIAIFVCGVGSSRTTKLPRSPLTLTVSANVSHPDGMHVSNWITNHQGFTKRTDEEQRRLQAEYKQCTSKSARKAFVKEFATRYCELYRLPYFDLCRMIVIDPMHNLFLGE